MREDLRNWFGTGKTGGSWKTKKNEQVQSSTPIDREWGTSSLVTIYKHDTPGESESAPLDESDYHTDVLAFNSAHEVLWQMWNLTPSEVLRAIKKARSRYPKAIISVQTPSGAVLRTIKPMEKIPEAWERNPNCQQCARKLSPVEFKRGDRVCAACVKKNSSRIWGRDADDEYEEQLDLLVKETDALDTVDEHIIKVKDGYRLISKSTGKNLGTYPTRAGAEQREREVQYFKQHESTRVRVPSFKTFLQS